MTCADLFTEEERDELMIAMNARATAMESRIKRVYQDTKGEPSAATLERLNERLAMIRRITVKLITT